MKKLLLIATLIFTTLGVKAQQYYGDDYDGGYRSDRYYYDDQFDWRWDVRVRITTGIQNGTITPMGADRLYDRLEQIENKEYAYQSDGYFEAWEQDEIWNDVIWLNRQVGLEINDYDRTFYGFSGPGVSFRGYFPWYYRRGYNVNRFDLRGFGDRRHGYASRNYRPQGRVYSERNRGYSNYGRPSYDRNRNENRSSYGTYGNGRNNNHNNSNRERNYERPNNNRNEGGRFENRDNNHNRGGSNERPSTPNTENRGGRNVERGGNTTPQNNTPSPSRGSYQRGSSNGGTPSQRNNGGRENTAPKMDNHKTESSRRGGRDSF